MFFCQQNIEKQEAIVFSIENYNYESFNIRFGEMCFKIYKSHNLSPECANFFTHFDNKINIYIDGNVFKIKKDKSQIKEAGQNYYLSVNEQDICLLNGEFFLK